MTDQPAATTAQEAAARAAIVAAVWAFAQRVDARVAQMDIEGGDAYIVAMWAELLALERTVAADGEGA